MTSRLASLCPLKHHHAALQRAARNSLVIAEILQGMSAQGTSQQIQQVNRPSGGRWLAHPLMLATLVAAVNAAKPAVVDDTAYLLYARHIARHPTDPYGFTIFWYTWPQPAFEVLAPPIYLYWLAAGWYLFGDNIPWLKLWTWPWLLLLAFGLRRLLRHWAPETERWMLPMLMLSPTILPMVNLMLDIPAYALGIAALSLWLADDSQLSVSCRWARALLAGLCLGLALQTKYNLSTYLPAVCLWGLLQRRWGPTLLATTTAVFVFVGWEAFCLIRYGNSHFWYHACGQAGSGPFWEQLQQKAALTGPLLGHWGCLGAAVGLCMAAAVGIPFVRLQPLLLLWLVGMLLVSLVPERFFLLSDGSSAVVLFWQCAGGVSLVSVSYGLYRLWLRPCIEPTGKRFERFLILWWLLEVVGYYLLTPFGAARRLIGLSLVSHLAAARLAHLPGQALAHSIMAKRHSFKPMLCVFLSVAMGVSVSAVDTLDAQPEKWCIERAAQALHEAGDPPPRQVWYAGHWGFQHYAQRQGWQQIQPQESIVRAGDYVVLPVPPEPEGFYRPHIGSRPICLPEGHYAILAEIVWDDLLPTQTIPNLYGGQVMLVGRDYPRLRVVTARLLTTWHP